MKRQTYRTLIVDDEEHCRLSLQRTISKYCPQLNIVDSVDSVEKARLSIIEHQPNLLFLDVEMPDETGLELIEQIGKTIPTIFTTAHEGYALQALKKQAVDYLLKPVDGKELIAAVNKVGEDRKNHSETHGKLVLPTTNGLLFTNPDDVIRCEGDGAYTKVFRENDSILVSRNIGHLEKTFAKHNFFRVHKSHLINLGHVREYIRGKGGIIIMSDNSHIDVSKRKREEFLLSIS